MPESGLDVLGIGNAIVDILSHAEETFLVERGLAKGAMTLVDGAQAESLYRLMGPGVESSGGSAANTAAGVASFGGRAGFIGKVGSDQFGHLFQHDIRSVGVRFDGATAPSGSPTARCLVLVTPDAQRTMLTHLGASVELGPADVDESLVASAKIVYLEGYLWDPPNAKLAFLKAAKVAHGAGCKVALSLSDPFCVERHRAEFLELVRDHVDILFANDREICSLFQLERFEDAVAATRALGKLAVLTRSEKGSVVLTDSVAHEVPAAPVGRIVDTTGAGDLYAAGFLYGYTQGRGLPECGRLASLAAAEVIGHFGTRPQGSLAGLVPADLRSPSLPPISSL